ncbi:hypothetical protein P7K49_008679 [Saguinus oedipus]|uniref:Uncharacterized protein n=1 Tax=Saguinus oedipus TaxID=9490 RepID=A0ABQ9W0R2_SAGOE|nr:hypothetical protein P7K49_008679 [Saguinus oedipus]
MKECLNEQMKVPGSSTLKSQALLSWQQLAAKLVLRSATAGLLSSSSKQAVV